MYTYFGSLKSSYRLAKKSFKQYQFSDHLEFKNSITLTLTLTITQIFKIRIRVETAKLKKKIGSCFSGIYYHNALCVVIT